MTEVNVTKAINISADAAWEKLSSFRGIENFSPIARSVVEGEGAGATRTCWMPDEAKIDERLNKVDHENMEMVYEIVEGPFPISDYVSTVKVKSLDATSCDISWGCRFDSAPEAEEQMKELFGGFYNVIIDSLETLVKSQN